MFSFLKVENLRVTINCVNENKHFERFVDGSR